MKVKPGPILLTAALILFTSIIAHADTYATFTTKRFFSPDNRYVVEVLPDKRATLYVKQRRLQKVWSRTLPELPGRLFISNDGTRVVVVDSYYGNGGSASANVIVFLDEAGNQVASHALGQIANLKGVLHTTSAAHWYYGAFFTPDEKQFVVETLINRCHPKTPDAAENCWKSDPFEEIRFSTVSGALISRADIRTKYADLETRFLHELEIEQSEHPPDQLNLAYAMLRLAHLYEDKGQYAKARGFYDRGIPILSKALYPRNPSVAFAVSEAATNCRKMKDHKCAQTLYRRSLAALDGGKKNPNNVVPAAITVYEDYAIFLREQNRNNEAIKMEERAKVLRLRSPDFKPVERY